MCKWRLVGHADPRCRHPHIYGVFLHEVTHNPWYQIRIFGHPAFSAHGRTLTVESCGHEESMAHWIRRPQDVEFVDDQTLAGRCARCSEVDRYVRETVECRTLLRGWIRFFRAADPRRREDCQNLMMIVGYAQERIAKTKALLLLLLRMNQRAGAAAAAAAADDDDSMLANRRVLRQCHRTLLHELAYAESQMQRFASLTGFTQWATFAELVSSGSESRVE